MRKVKCRIYSRVVGYYSEVEQNWNAGKREEFRQRVPYSVTVSLASTRSLTVAEREMKMAPVEAGVLRA